MRNSTGKFIALSTLCLLFSGCRNEDSRQVLSNAGEYAFEQTDTNSYPMLIDNGSRVVYQFGHMTPDKGLKLYPDTIATPKGGLLQDEILRRRLSPHKLEGE